MLTIRLSRTGKKKQPQYRVVLQENHRDPWSPAKEILGHYNPRAKENNIVLEADRIKHWISVGAKPSATVHNMLVNAGIIEADKEGVVTISKKRTKKMEAKKAEKQEKDLADKEAKKAAKEAEVAKAKEEKEAAEAKKAEEAVEVKEEVVETPAEEAAADVKEEAPTKTEEEPTKEAPAEKTAE